MTVNFPTVPPTGGIRSVEVRLAHATARTESPFTFAHQVQDMGGERWEATVTLAPMTRDDAERWLVFLLAQRGGLGTFLMGPETMARSYAGSKSMNQISTATGGRGDNEIRIVAGNVTDSDFFKAGDWIQIGQGEDAHLYKFLEDASLTSGIGTDVAVTPRLRDRYMDTPIRGVGPSSFGLSPVGVWRLATNVTGWTVDMMGMYSMTFTAVEAL